MRELRKAPPARLPRAASRGCKRPTSSTRGSVRHAPRVPWLGRPARATTTTPVAEIVRVEVHDLRHDAGPLNRFPCPVLGGAEEHPALGQAIIERTCLLDDRHQPLGHLHPPSPAGLRLAAAETEAVLSHVHVPPLERSEFADPASLSAPTRRAEADPTPVQRRGSPGTASRSAVPAPRLRSSASSRACRAPGSARHSRSRAPPGASPGRYSISSIESITLEDVPPDEAA